MMCVSGVDKGLYITCFHYTNVVHPVKTLFTTKPVEGNTSMHLSLIDILFLVTVLLLVFNGFRNGAVFSLIHLLSIPIGAAVVFYYGPRFTALLTMNGISATPLIAYLVLFFSTVLVLHILGTMLRGVLKHIPVIGCGDALIGGAVGAVEAWLLWVVLLLILGSFIMHAQDTAPPGAQIVPGLNMQVQQLQAWRDFYNQAISNSLFARVNSFFVKSLPGM